MPTTLGFSLDPSFPPFLPALAMTSTGRRLGYSVFHQISRLLHGGRRPLSFHHPLAAPSWHLQALEEKLANLSMQRVVIVSVLFQRHLFLQALRAVA